jgi:hypothetical protein
MKQFTLARMATFALPALWLHNKFALSWRAFHDLDDDTRPTLCKFDRPALVALIHQNRMQSWEAPFGFMKNVFGTITIRN